MPFASQGVLVVGADSAVGSALLDRLSNAGVPVRGTSRRMAVSKNFPTSTQHFHDTQHLDLAFPDLADPAIYADPPAVAVICAAIAQVELCRDQPELTARVNVAGTKSVCMKLAERGSRIVFLSTSQVFDGLHPFMAPDAVVSPFSEYGRQKAEVERFLAASSISYTVVRLSKVLTERPPILQRWIDDLKASKPVDAFTDLLWAPVPLDFVTATLAALSQSKHVGTFQVSAKQESSYAETAYRVARAINADRSLVRAVTMAEAGMTLYPSNRHCTLDASRVENLLGLTPPDLWGCIDSCIENICAEQTLP